ncbi:MAG: PH domain-containing protein [Patescibacteria group bacterium]
MIEQIPFEGKNEGETLLVFTRRHWYTLFGMFASAVFASFVPVILIAVFAQFILAHENGALIFLFFWMIYLMSIWYVLAYKLTMHSLDTWIVTNERILDIVQIGFFNRKVSELHLESIQDISVNTKGVVESYLNFGNIEIQTGATAQRFMFDKVPNPIDIKDTIMDAAKLKEQNVKRDL